jgi:uncharacterized radical SAM superfamily Fe-S cluster-containing enzyme
MDNVERIVIMEFSDVFNFDTTNIKKECNFMIETEKVIPFSTYNMEIKFSQRALICLMHINHLFLLRFWHNKM